jgi:hypothetical protein
VDPVKRAFVFLLLAPLAVALIAALLVVWRGEPGGEFAPLFAVLIGAALFCCTLPVSALAGYVDDALSNVPVLPRASLIAAIGAIISFILFCWASPPAGFPLFFAICGGAGMGLCSLLANATPDTNPSYRVTLHAAALSRT